jgi:hypothetical protein
MQSNERLTKQRNRQTDRQTDRKKQCREKERMKNKKRQKERKVKIGICAMRSRGRSQKKHRNKKLLNS